MNFKEALDNMEEISSTIKKNTDESELINAELDSNPEPSGDVPISTQGGETELLDSLNQIFTPILVMQGFESDVGDKIQEAFSEASVLMEKNIIQFDNATKMAQLISVCALLIEQQKNTHEYQMYKKAAEIKKAMKINIQKKNYAAAQALAQKFLVKVSTTNNSSIARKAANELLPETQH